MNDRTPWKRGPQRALLALCEALLPAEPAVAEAPVRVTRILLEHAEVMSPLMRLSFLMGLRLLDWSPVLLLRSVHRLSRLKPTRRRELMDRWLHSRIYLQRQIAVGYNGPIFVTYYDLPELREALDYRVDAYVAERKRRHAALLEDDAAEGREAPRERSMIRR